MIALDRLDLGHNVWRLSWAHGEDHGRCSFDRLVQGTPLDERPLSAERLSTRVRSDVFRTLALLQHGGIYYDLDVVFLRDLRCLTSVELVYVWTDHPYANTAVMHFRKASLSLRALATRACAINSCYPAQLYREVCGRYGVDLLANPQICGASR